MSVTTTAAFSDYIITNLTTQLQSSNSQFKTLLPLSIDNIETVESKVGLVPKGSILSYQQKKCEKQTNTTIINNDAYPNYPDYDFPTLVQKFETVLTMGEMNVYDRLHVTKIESYDIGKNTTDQSKNPFWKSIHNCRLTSSCFKRICSRKKEYETLADRLLSGNKIQTSAMKFGLEHENDAAESYAVMTGNNVFKAGFVINPSSCHIGTSPDRKVIDPSSVPMQGLLEIKCPNSDSITNLNYLTLTNNTYKLKTTVTHEYYYEIMGQMGMTGAL